MDIKADDFVALLRGGVGVQQAYEVLHRDEILGDVAQGAAEYAKEQLLETLRVRGLRPDENGLSRASATVTKKDVSKLSKHEREQIERRVLKGERVVF